MEYAIAWDYEPDNPNPHSLVLGTERWPNETGATLEAERANAEEKADGHEPSSWVIIEIR